VNDTSKRAISNNHDRFQISTFGLTQKYQKVKADDGMFAKATRGIIHAIRAVRFLGTNYTLRLQLPLVFI
jgi:hypothetical protein